MADREPELPVLDAHAVLASIGVQLASGQDVVRIGGHGIVHRSYAWAIARSLRLALDTGGTFDTPTQDEDGAWWAHITVPIGRYPA